MPIAVGRSALFRRSYRHINHGWGGRLLHMKQPGRVLDPDFQCLVLEVRHVHCMFLGSPSNLYTPKTQPTQSRGCLEMPLHF